MAKSYKPGAKAGAINADGYVVVELDGEELYAHDIAWILIHGAPPKTPLVHINGVRHDNRIANLRES
jgi:hypothetical protein